MGCVSKDPVFLQSLAAFTDLNQRRSDSFDVILQHPVGSSLLRGREALPELLHRGEAPTCMSAKLAILEIACRSRHLHIG
jgi:hypothetical protein